MNFKDFVAADLATFMNPNEMAEIHDIDGLMIPAILDSNTLKGGVTVDGVYGNEMILFVRKSDLPARPVIDQHMRVDGKRYLVSKCDENSGIFEILLVANRA